MVYPIYLIISRIGDIEFELKYLTIKKTGRVSVKKIKYACK